MEKGSNINIGGLSALEGNALSLPGFDAFSKGFVIPLESHLSGLAKFAQTEETTERFPPPQSDVSQAHN